MPLQHFLPATFLASFSKDTNFPRRDRVLYAGNNKNGNIFSAKAKQLAVIKDLYTLKGPDEVAPLFIDEILSGYEPRLSKAIEQLINQDITALNWATVLVPFVVGLLVRGTDFNKRFHYRMSYIGLGVDTDNINYARWMEYQRLLAPIATAKWIVLNINSDDPMITNDYGYAPFINPSVGHYGVAIPIGLSNILVLVPIPKRIVAVAKGGTWDPQIDYSIEGFNNHIELNKVTVVSPKKAIEP